MAGANVLESAALNQVLDDFNPMTDLLYVNRPEILGHPESCPVTIRSSGDITMAWYAPLTSNVAQLFCPASFVIIALGDIVAVAASSILLFNSTKSQQ